MEIDELINKVKNKKELRDLDEDFVRNVVVELSKKYKDKDLFKEARRILRLAYGMYKVKENSLEKHPSTRERFAYYKEIYNKIFEITGKPSIILDLGCGINPLSYYYLGCKPEYYACDIGQDYVNIVNEFFSKNKITGRAFLFDLAYGDYSKLPKADVCLLFKVLEALELIKRNISREIVKKLSCKYIVASFAKKALGGKITIRKKGRIWFKRILNELGYKYDILDIGDEIFYVISKY